MSQSSVASACSAAHPPAPAGGSAARPRRVFPPSGNTGGKSREGEGGPSPGDVVLVNGGRYFLHHAVVESVRGDLGPGGFAVLRFFGLSGYPLKGLVRSSILPAGRLFAFDLVPLENLNVWSAEA